MFGMLDFMPAPWQNNVWTPWIKHMMGHVEDCGVLQAAMIKIKKKQPVACTKQFMPSTSDIQSIIEAMDDKALDKIKVKDKLFTLLPRSFTSDPNVLVGCHGDKYVVISTSKTMYVMLLIKRTAGEKGADRLRKALDLLKKVTDRLCANNY